eukprot:6186476-Prymnesium_polylepis.1
MGGAFPSGRWSRDRAAAQARLFFVLKESGACMAEGGEAAWMQRRDDSLEVGPDGYLVGWQRLGRCGGTTWLALTMRGMCAWGARGSI